MPEVRAARRTDVGALAAMLARAFATDPLSETIFPDARSRPRRLERFFGFQLLHNYLPRGEVYTIGDGAAAALWLPPDPAPAPLFDRLAALELVTLLGHGYRFTSRLAVLLGARHPRFPHYYLGILGTDPVAQRRGLASALLDSVLARCDERGFIAYLECSKEANIGFYARFGFFVREELELPEMGPRLWLMERAPRTT